MTRTLSLIVAIVLFNFSMSALASGQNKVPTPIVKPHKTLTAWVYEDEKDEIAGETIYFASAKSTNKIHFDFPYQGGTTGWIILRKHPRFGDSANFVIDKGQLLCSSYNGCYVTFKFDNNPPVTYSATAPSDHNSNALIFGCHKKFLEELKTAKQLIVEAEFFQSGLQHFKFNVANLKWE